MYQRNWNQALAQLVEMDKDLEDEAIRDAIHFDRLSNRVVRGRDDFF